MVDLLWHERGTLCRTGARANNYRGATPSKYVDPDAARTRCKPPVVSYLIRIIHDPLEIGGFAKGTSFSVLEYTEMKHRCAFTPGTILKVRGTLRIINRRNGYQVASKYNPPSL
jgi:hypothetical protein